MRSKLLLQAILLAMSCMVAGHTMGAPQTSTATLTTTYTYLGTETLIVPAGTFLTCKLREQSIGDAQPTTTWRMVGYGATVKSITGTTTQTLTAITVNGVPLTQFP